jgi:phosphomannomutase
VRLLEQARAWIHEDPDPETRHELESDIERGALDEVGARFGEPLRFGTSGIRGPLGAGPARMNLATVRRVSASLAAELLSQAPAGAQLSVVVGRDARHGSELFAAQAARVLRGAGLRVLLLPRPLPTPVLAFAVRELSCAAGVMVTASHNPPEQNGLKIYTHEGAQIVAPLDERIAQRMGSLAHLREVPLGDEGELLDERVLQAYLERIAGLACCRPARKGARAQPRVLYTPLHGVGASTLRAAFARAGRPPVDLFAPQADPDPDFATLVRPNPEERDALAPVLAAGTAGDYELVLANDPDADRLAVAIRSPEPEEGGIDGDWRVLSGDEIGVLLAEHVLRRGGGGGSGLLVTTVASSTLLAEVAHVAGVPFAQTLTGFKWVMRAADARADVDGLLFGYEEALGYAVTDQVRDKDGISAALALCACAEDAALEGQGLAWSLEGIARRFGLHATRQLSLQLDRADAAARAEEAMHALRARAPRELAGARVDWWEDLLDPSSARAAKGTRADRARVPGLPPADVLVFGCGAHTRAVVRASGTEPKLKVYLQSVQTVQGELRCARARAQQHLDELEQQMRALVREVAALEAA